MSTRQVALKILGIVSRELLSSQLLRGASLSFITRVSGVGIAYIAHMLLANWMGADGYGEYTYVITWSNVLATLAGLGLTGAVLRFIPEYQVKFDWPRFKGIIVGSQLLVGCAGLLLSLAGTGWILLSKPQQASWVDRSSMLLGLWLVPAFGLMNLQTQILLALHRVDLAQVPSMVLKPVLLLAGASILRSVGVTPTASLAITFITLVIVLVVQWLGCIQHQPASVIQVRPEFAWAHWLNVSFPLMLAGMFAFVVNQVDVLMVGTMLGPREVGIYSAAVKTASIANFVLVAVNSVVVPSVAALHAKGDVAALQSLVTKATHLAFWPSVMISIGLVFLGAPVLSLFGREFALGRSILAILLIGHLFSAAHGTVGYLLNVTGHERLTAWVLGLSALVDIVLNVLLIPIWGAMGAAVATTTTLAILNVSQYFLVARKIGIHSSVLYDLLTRCSNVICKKA